MKILQRLHLKYIISNAALQYYCHLIVHGCFIRVFYINSVFHIIVTADWNLSSISISVAKYYRLDLVMKSIDFWSPTRNCACSPACRLFLCYINDITKNINSIIKLYADDILIYTIINSESDCKNLQKDL